MTTQTKLTSTQLMLVRNTALDVTMGKLNLEHIKATCHVLDSARTEKALGKVMEDMMPLLRAVTALQAKDAKGNAMKVGKTTAHFKTRYEAVHGKALAQLDSSDDEVGTGVKLVKDIVANVAEAEIPQPGRAVPTEGSSAWVVDAVTKGLPVKASRKTAKPTKPCLCGCGAQVVGMFKQGHDAKTKSWFLALARDLVTDANEKARIVGVATGMASLLVDFVTKNIKDAVVSDDARTVTFGKTKVKVGK